MFNDGFGGNRVNLPNTNIDFRLPMNSVPVNNSTNWVPQNKFMGSSNQHHVNITHNIHHNIHQTVMSNVRNVTSVSNHNSTNNNSIIQKRIDTSSASSLRESLKKCYTQEKNINLGFRWKKVSVGYENFVIDYMDSNPKKVLNCFSNLLDQKFNHDHSGSNGLKNIKAINLSYSNIDDDLFIKPIKDLGYFNFDLDLICLKNNKLKHYGVSYLIFSINSYEKQHVKTLSNTPKSHKWFFKPSYEIKYTDINCIQRVKVIDLSNNQLDDECARFISGSIAKCEIKGLRELHIYGNKITKKGEKLIVKAMKNPAVKDLVVLTEKLDNSLKLSFGSKSQRIKEMKSLLQKAKNKGVDIDSIVVDKSFYTYIKNSYLVNKKFIFGYAKCKWVDDFVSSYAQGKLIAKLPKTLAKSISNTLNVKDHVSCIVKENNNAYSSEPGVQIIKTNLYLMGANDVFDE